ncbi:phage protein [Desulfocucumis palustris]|uniref:Phage protein n=1 Tax=Desulfocucumis palustris TaxID=1898651 RepID=A0A2L2XD35_9FIRM|nr:DUF935 family protein [Desulfocucumis palustris]GBF34135.1 phage protein [Desulfocucumis palustris]
MSEAYRPAVGQIGSQLNTTFSLFDGAVINPDAALVPEYERMLDTDETVSASFYFLTLCVISFLGEYNHPDKPEITQFVMDCFEEMEGSLAPACEDILSSVWAGYSVTEIIWKAVGTRLMLDYLATYHPSTITFDVTERGRLKNIQQLTVFNAIGADLPPEKCIVFSYRKRFGNHYGKSAFKPVRKNWLLKDAFLKMWARAADKFGTPLLVAIVPDGTIKDPESGEDIDQLQYATKMLANVQSGTALALSSKGGGGTGSGQVPDVKALVAGGSGVGDTFESAMGYFNKMISRGLLVPSLVFDEGARSGSLALGTSHFFGFLLMARAIFVQLKEVLLDQFICRLIEYNFGKQKNWGDFQERPPSAEELKLWTEIFDGLTRSGTFDPAIEEDFRYARAKMGLPDRAPNNSLKVKAAYERYKRAGE